MCERELSDIDSISILGFEREYLDGLLEVAAHRKPGQHLLVLFLGSTIGNFDRMAGLKFLNQVRRILQPGDSLLLGTDLEKPAAQLLAAYDDELGVTAAFNLNLLARINRELGGDFDLAQFEHWRKSITNSQRGNASPLYAPPNREYSRRRCQHRISQRRNYLDRKQP